MKIAFAHHEPINPKKARWVAIVRSVAAVAELQPVVWYTANTIDEITKYATEQLGLELPSGLTIQTLSSVHKRFGLTLNKVYFRALRKALNADVLWLRSDKLAAFAAHKMPDTPMVYEAHLVGELWSQDKGDSNKKALRQAEIERQIYSKTAGVAAISNGLLTEIRQRFKYTGPSTIARSAVDMGLFQPVWQGGSNRIVYVGTLQFWKGLNILLDALALTDFELEVIGDGKEKDLDALRNKISELGLSERVHLLGRLSQPEIPDAVKDCLCAVHPLPAEHSISARFTSPLKVMEYMAMGLPIVASDVPSVREILTNNGNALLYEAGSAESLAAALNQTKDAQTAQRISTQATQDAQKYTYKQRAKKLVELFNNVGT
ncbi:MAG: glycosyltransferase family 4 protein [Planctomycetota bacterium]